MSIETINKPKDPEEILRAIEERETIREAEERKQKKPWLTFMLAPVWIWIAVSIYADNMMPMVRITFTATCLAASLTAFWFYHRNKVAEATLKAWEKKKQKSVVLKNLKQGKPHE